VRGAGVTDARGMNQLTVPVHLELSIGDGLSGRAVYAAGTVRHFRGSAGLVAMIDALVEEARAGRLQLHAENPIPHERNGASGQPRDQVGHRRPRPADRDVQDLRSEQ
jgi:hypothetical protein